MPKAGNLEKEKFIFGSLFLLSNKLQVIMDQGLASHEITTKQWFLMAVLGEFFDTPPTLTEVAEIMGNSHQNVKQIALKLEKKGFLEMKKDQQDRRAIRISITDKCHSFWNERQEEDKFFLTNFFEDLSENEISAMYNGLAILTNKVKTYNLT